MIESGYLGVENYGRARGHVGDSEEEEDDVEEDEENEEEEIEAERRRKRRRTEGSKGAFDKDSRP